MQQLLGYTFWYYGYQVSVVYKVPLAFYIVVSLLQCRLLVYQLYPWLCGIVCMCVAFRYRPSQPHWTQLVY